MSQAGGRAPGEAGRQAGRVASSYRLRRGPALGVLLLVAVVGAYVVLRGSLSPQVDLSAPVTVPEAYAGTTYALDGVVCLRGRSTGASVASVSSPGGTRLGLRPPGSALAVAFPVDPGAVDRLEGARVPSGDELCTRLLVTPSATGEVRAGPVEITLHYGPFGLLSRTRTVRPPVVLQVTGTGTDPRRSAG